MGTIKFRAWNRVYNTMENWNHVKHWQALGELFSSDEYVFMQFSEIYDKNAKEIYAGDILRLANNEIITVTFFRGSFLGIRKNKTFSMTNFYWVYSEIIGNIYENPELLV